MLLGLAERDLSGIQKAAIQREQELRARIEELESEVILPNR